MSMENNRRSLFTFKVGWFCYLLTAAIVAARAFQPNAQPMCDWSWWSWLLMTLPVTMPVVLMAVWLVLYAAAGTLVAVLSAVGKIWRTLTYGK